MPDAEGPPSAPTATAATASADEGLGSEDELELALEAELESAADGAEQHQQADGERDQQGAAPPAGATAQGDVARAATAATAVLQEEEEALPLTEDGFIDLARLTAKQHQRYNTCAAGWRWRGHGRRIDGCGFSMGWMAASFLR